MKQIEVQIMGQSYLLASSDEGESMLRQAVAKVDTAMCQIRDAGKIKARDRIAVLAALNIAAQGIAQTVSPVTAPSASNHQSSGDDSQYADLMSKLDKALA